MTKNGFMLSRNLFTFQLILKHVGNHERDDDDESDDDERDDDAESDDDDERDDDLEMRNNQERFQVF